MLLMKRIGLGEGRQDSWSSYIIIPVVADNSYSSHVIASM